MEPADQPTPPSTFAATRSAPAVYRAGPWWTVAAALLTEIVIIAAAGNQSVTNSLQNKLNDPGRHYADYTRGGLESIITFSWRFAPANGEATHLWAARLAGIGALLVLTAIGVFVIARGSVTFGRVFVASWAVVAAVAPIAIIVRNLIIVPNTPGPLQSRVGQSVYGETKFGSVIVAGLVLGLLAGLLAGLVAVAARKAVPVELREDARGEYGDYGAQTSAYEPPPWGVEPPMTYEPTPVSYPPPAPVSSWDASAPQQQWAGPPLERQLEFEPSQATEAFPRSDQTEQFARADDSERFAATSAHEQFAATPSHEQFAPPPLNEQPPRTDETGRYAPPETTEASDRADDTDAFARSDQTETFARPESVQPPASGPQSPPAPPPAWPAPPGPPVQPPSWPAPPEAPAQAPAQPEQPDQPAQPPSREQPQPEDDATTQFPRITDDDKRSQ